MTGVVARTTTHAFNNAAWPYILQIAAKGLDQAILDDAALRHGLNVHAGQIVHPALLGAVDGSVAPGWHRRRWHLRRWGMNWEETYRRQDLLRR